MRKQSMLPLFIIFIVLSLVFITAGVVLIMKPEANSVNSNSEIYAESAQTVNKNIAYQDNTYTVTRFYDGFNTCYIAQNNNTYDVALTCVK